MSSSIVSLNLLSLASSKTLSFAAKPPSPSSLFFFPSSFKSFPKFFSVPASSSLFQASQFFRNVAVSPDFEVEEDFSSDEEQQSFSPDLKIFVGNLPFTVDSAALAGLFERCGNVEMVEVIYDKVSGRSRGFGFVTMSSMKEVEAAAQKFNGYEIDGRQLRVNYGPPPPREESSMRGSRNGGREGSSFGGREGSSFRGSRDGGHEGSSFRGSRDGGRGGGRSFDNSNRVFVGNLSWSVDDEALETLFREQGNVTEAKVVFDRDSGRSRGFGFVTYSSADEVNKAIDSLDGADLDGRNIRVSAAESPQRRQF